jgi:hypothetical protein
VAATDLHHPDGAEEWLPEAIEALEERAGSAELARLCSANPLKVLAGGELA